MSKRKPQTDFEAKLNAPSGVRLPDNFYAEYGKKPSAHFVVSFDRNGKPLSCYGDAIWNMTAYQRRHSSSILNFHSWTENPFSLDSQAIIDDMKWLLFVTIYFSVRNLAVSTLQLRLVMLKSMARYCHRSHTTPALLLGNPVQFSEFVNTIKDNANIKALSSFVSDIYSIGPQKTGITLLTGIGRDELKRLSNDACKNSKQHPVIPTRIYAALITNFMDEIERFEAFSDRFLSLIDACASDSFLGRSLSAQRKTIKKCGVDQKEVTLRPQLKEMIDAFELRDYIDDVTDRHEFEIKHLKKTVRWLTNIQWLCNQVIHIFSGMRDGEANRLPYDCLETPVYKGKKHYRLIGNTTKLTKDVEKPARWVTCEQAAKAVSIAQQIAYVIYKKIGFDNPGSLDGAKTSDFPLFIGTGYLGFTPLKTKSTSVPYTSSRMLPEQVFKTWIPSITQEDIDELESIDPFRDWHSEEKFAIGELWPLTDHQYRRSLAVYASASGLVTLPSLRQQLQQLTEEMAVYYAKGSAYAKDLVQGDKGHFYHDYQAQQPESQALAYIAQVLLSNEPIFGAHGTWIDRRIERDEPISNNNRKETIIRFNRGELAYKSTPLGGCTTVEPCDKKALRSVVGCLECSKAVIKLTKLDRVIKVQEAFLSRLEPDSIAAQAKKNDLDKLATYRAKIQGKQELRRG